MSAFPRRSILRGLAALPLAGVPVAAVATIMPDPIFAAIEKHKAAYAAFQVATANVPDVVHPPQHLEDAQSLASDIEIEVRYDMHEVVPQTIAGLVAYATYWNAFCEPLPGYKFGQLSELGWEAIPTIAEAMTALFPIGGAA